MIKEYSLGIMARYKTSIRIAVESENIFHSFSTMLVSFIIQPIFSIGFLVIIASSMQEKDLATVTIASYLITLGMGIIQSLIRQIVQDMNLDIYRYDKKIIFHSSYWLGKVFIAILPQYLLFTASSIVIELIGINSRQHLLRNIVITQQCAALIMVTAIIFGITTAILSQLFTDAYLLSNIITLVFPVTATVIAPIDDYPRWMQIFCSKLPFTHTISAYRHVIAINHMWLSPVDAFSELAVLLLWTIIFMAIYFGYSILKP